MSEETEKMTPADAEAVLSKDDVKRLKAEFVLREELRKTLPPKSKSGLNGPFCVTVVGGIILAIVALVIESSVACHSDRVQHVRQLRKEQVDAFIQVWVTWRRRLPT